MFSSKDRSKPITEIYIFAIIIIFPLCVDSTGFFRILECKYRTFQIISVSYIALSLIILIYYYIFNKIKIFEDKKLSIIQICVIAFWLINVISCLFSPYLNEYNLLVGVGRGEGLINITLYCLSFIAITLFGKFRKRANSNN